MGCIDSRSDDDIEDDGGPVNVGVDDNTITYDVPQKLTSLPVSFSITSIDGEREVCNFQIIGHKGKVFRKHESKPFPKGTIQRKQFKLLHFVDIWIYFLNIINSGVGDMHEARTASFKGKDHYVVTVTNTKANPLAGYFM